MALALTPTARAGIEGSAAATGWYRGQPVMSAPAHVVVPVTGARARLTVVLRPVSGGFLHDGETVDFAAELVNGGNVSLSGLVVETERAAEIGCDEVASLPPGGKVVCRLATAVTPADIAAGELAIEVEARATDPAGAEVRSGVAHAGIPATRADLVTVLSLVPGETGPQIGAPMPLRVYVMNDGPDDADNVAVRIELPEGLSHVADDGDGRFDVASSIWRIGMLAAGSEAALELRVRPEPGTAGRQLAVAAHVVRSDRHDGRDEGDRNRLVLAIPAADLDGWIVLQPAGPVRVGEPLLLVVSLANRGPDAAEEVGLNLSVPEGFVLSRAEASIGIFADGYWRLGTLLPGQSATLRLEGTASMAAAGGAIAMAEAPEPGTLTGDPRPGPLLLPAPVPVSMPVLEAAPDHAEGLDGVAGAPDFVNLLANDRIDGRPVTPEEVFVATADAGPLRLAPNGWLSLSPGTAEGRYRLRYRLCLRVLPHICTDGAATAEVAAPAAIAGIVFRDANGSGAFEPEADVPLAGHSVALLADGRRVARAVTDAGGHFRFAELAAADAYRIVVHDPAGAFAGGLAGLMLPAGQGIDGLAIATDPTGIVYDAISRRPLAGVTLAVTGPDGEPLPAACFLAEPGQTTGVDGAYRIALAAGSDPACPAAGTVYRLAVTPPDGYAAVPSVLLPPLPGPVSLRDCPFDATPGGLCTAAPRAEPPAIGSPATYFLEFRAGAGDRMALHNHIPVDPAAGGTLAELSVAVAAPDAGAAVALAVTAGNGGPSPLSGVSLEAVLPAGFDYVPGTAEIDGVTVTPETEAALFRIAGLDIEPGESRTVRLRIRPQPGLAPGDYAARIRLFDADGSPVSAEVRAVITAVPGTPAPACAGIAGRMFIDRNGNGRMDAGEAGIGGVVIRAAGIALRSDRAGHFRLHCRDVPGLAPDQTVTVEIETATLPEGYRLGSDPVRRLRLTMGEVAMADFALEAGRVVLLEISDSAFEQDSLALRPRWRDGISGLIDTLAAEFSVLSIRYHGGDRLAAERLQALSALVRGAWRERGEPYPLAIRSEVIN